MNLIFAHHAMVEAFDVLHFHPVTAGQHALALAAYGLILAGAALGVSTGFHVLRARVRESRACRQGGPRVAGPAEGSR